MKPEPLKDKETCLNCLNTPCNCGLNNSAFIKWNVASAVEWLNKRTYVVDDVLIVDWDNVKEAFQDVIKK